MALLNMIKFSTGQNGNKEEQSRKSKSQKVLSINMVEPGFELEGAKLVK